jgi:hypothetical protein
VSLANILEWNKQNGENEYVTKLEEELEENKLECEKIQNERAKKMSKLKGEKLDQWLLENPFDEDVFLKPKDE